MLGEVIPPGSGLSEITASWHGRLRPAVLRVAVTLWTGVIVSALLLARVGTSTWRLGAIALLLFALVLTIGLWLVRRRRSQRLARRATAVVRHVDRDLALALDRALRLEQEARTRSPAVSVELAALHLQRTMARVPIEQIEQRATRIASRLANLTAVVGVAIAAFAWLARRDLVEGANVLLAIRGTAPFEMSLLELDLVTLQPPSYLRQQPDWVEFNTSTAAPRGSQISVRGVPSRVLSRLVLTDGKQEIPFKPDGKGAVAAQYRLLDSTRLSVAARFGEVLIRQNDVLALEAIVDPVPSVELEGAPRRVAWAEANPFELHYRVVDDHGLREVDLVLRTAAREERRALARLDGSTRYHSGAQAILADDAFVSGAYGSVEISITARDDNTFDGNGWGRSAAIVLDKPALGSAEVRRRKGYLGLREDFTNWLAAVQQAPGGSDRATQAMTRALDRLDQVDVAAQNDIAVKRIMRTFLHAQRDKLKRAMIDKGKLVTTLEEVTLAFDAAAETVAQHDAQHVSRLLANVAIEIEMGAKEALLAERREQGNQRVMLARGTLSSGARELRELGALGADLGEIALAGAARIASAHAASDWVNVGRAASFLAERLRRPVPSFRGGGGRAGVESAQLSRGQGRPRASEADTRLERVSDELTQLVRDHAAEIDSVERIVQASDAVTGSADLLPEAKQRAARLRSIVEPLPPLGAEPGSPRAALALGKELVIGAAESLERLQLLGSYENLKRADSALAEAQALGTPAELRSETARSAEIRGELAEQRRWIKEMLDNARAKVAQQFTDSLRKASQREREIAVRAKELSLREAKRDAVLPDEVRADLERASNLMQQAAGSLEIGRGRVALDGQKQAQQLLERNQPEPDQQQRVSQQEPKDTSRGDQQREAKGGPVVSTSDVESRESFRRRVQEGLSKEVSPDLSKAVRRYAEGLLR